MQVAADTVTAEFSYDSETVGDDRAFDRRRNVRQMVSRTRLFDTLVERCLGHLEQLPDFSGNLADRNGHGMVSDESVVGDSEIDSDHVTVFQNPFPGRNPVNHFVIDRNAERPRKPPISLEGRTALSLERLFFGDTVQVVGADAVLAVFTHDRQHLGVDLRRDLHSLDFLRGL